MPQIDRRSGDVVMRIVYDGAPEAGKTTNIQRLCEAVALQRRGSVKALSGGERRTEYFDWLDFAGGVVDGRKVRCQIVSVPGQSEVLHRRRYLLKSADAVVFVADSRRDHVDSAVKSFETTLRIMEGVSGDADLGLVFQANKQDLDGALDPEALARVFELPASGVVIGARALTGQGVMQSFMMAVRLATQRFRKLLAQGALPENTSLEEDPETLYELMLRNEPEGTKRSARHSLFASDIEDPEPQLEPLASHLNRPLTSILPLPSEVSGGTVWPPTTGRQLLTTAGLDDCLSPEFLSPWVPQRASEFLTSTWHAFHTFPEWLFEHEHEARRTLVEIVRAHLCVLPLLPEGRVLFMAIAADGFRLWMGTPKLVTLRDLLEKAVAERSAAFLSDVLLGAYEISSRAENLPNGASRGMLGRSLSSYGRSASGDWALLSLPDPTPDDRSEGLLEELLQPVKALSQRHHGFSGLAKDAYEALPEQARTALSFLKEGTLTW